MISEREREIIIRHAKKYEVSLVYQFGSALDSSEYLLELSVHKIRFKDLIENVDSSN